MKTFQILAFLGLAVSLLTTAVSQNLNPGTVTFKNIYGDVYAVNDNTGAREEITEETSLTEGFTIVTDGEAYVDIEFSNGVVGRISPNTRLKIESFQEAGGFGRSDDRFDLRNNSLRRSGMSEGLSLQLECGDVIMNATEKTGGDFLLKTDVSEIRPDFTKFFASYGNTPTNDQKVNRTINLGVMPLEVNSTVASDFTNNTSSVSYAYYDSFGSQSSRTLNTENSAVILAPRASLDDCNDAVYGVVAYDTCLIDQLGGVADNVLNGQTAGNGYILITAAGDNASYFNIETGEIGDLQPGTTIPEGSIIRTGGDSTATAVFPNGATMEVEPNSNIVIDSVSSQPILNEGVQSTQTNIVIRVESGKAIVNTTNVPPSDNFEVISPLDRSNFPSNSLVSVEFLIIDESAFQTVTQNQSTQQDINVNNTVVTASALSFINNTSTFLEYAAEGEPFEFQTPPTFTHITESAVFPADYDFIDRTLAGPAGPQLPTALTTPGNPGNIIQNQVPGDDPVSP